MASDPKQLSLEKKELETVEGVLERVVYTNEETAWSVVKVQLGDRRDPITCVGSLLGVQIGENLRLSGKFIHDKKWGPQFEVKSYVSVKPATLKGIERYLASGLVPGIGKEMAKRLVEHFGIDTLEVIENDARRLVEVEGIGPIRRKRILDAWGEQRDIKNVMVFLQTHGVSTAYAIRIYKKYGSRAISIVRDNPYQLAEDIFGIGFLSADRIAQSLGIDKRAPKRAEAGVLFALGTLTDEGHVFAPRDSLVDRSKGLLEIDLAIIEAAIDALVDANALVRENDALYLKRLYDDERYAAERLDRILKTETQPIAIDVERAIAWFEESAKITLAPGQRRALERAISAKVMVITGGPGTGKTTIVNGIIRILDKKNRRILLAAPTGRAAKRMSETTGKEAKTIHRLLEFDPHAQSFVRNQEHPLEADMVIVDETSMVDAPLFAHLVAALPERAQLVLVGDVDQLPSVGPGRVLGDIIQSGRAEVAVLDQIFRQAEASLIIVNAHRINRGELPQLDRSQRDSVDFFLIERESPEDVLATIRELMANRIPARFHLDPISEIQVLTPMHRGSLGASNLNAELQALLNPDGDALSRGDRLIRRGDKVMQLRNNYDLGVFNGDLGRVTQVHAADRALEVSFEDRAVRYEAADLDELALAYACSIHKSQGSEYPAVILPLSTQHFMMLERNLLYTAVTRAKRLVVIVGQKRALQMAVNNHDQRTRWTRFEARLRALKEDGTRLVPDPPRGEG
jgi:exodeoxyribonuclease V alpha subunit